jgi:predicted ABC-type ATPase
LKRNKIQETFAKENIKNRIENIGFFVETTKIEDNKQKLEKIKNKVELNNIII